MKWLERRRELRRLRERWLREHRGGAYVITTEMEPGYDPPSGSMNPDARASAVDNLDLQDGIATAIWFVPPSEGVEPHYAFDYYGTGPKRYLNLWLRTDQRAELADWGWVLHESAVLLWRTPTSGDTP